MDEKILTELQAELKTFIAKQSEELQATGKVQADTKNAIIELSSRIDELDKRIATKDSKPEDKSLALRLKENDLIQRVIRGESGKGRFEMKMSDLLEQKTTFTATSSAGFATSGVYQIDRTPGIVLEARRRLHPQDVLPSRPTSLAYVDFVKVNAAISDGSPQGGEGAAKFENTTSLNTTSRKVQTIATWIKASKQALDDMAELEGYLKGALAYAVAKEFGEQLYSGSGTGYNLSGLTTEAQAFDTALLSASQGYTYIDTIAAAAQQIDADEEVPADFVMLHPTDVWNIQRTKNDDGDYIIGNPRMNGPFTLWGLNVVPSSVVTAGTFLVGSSASAAAEIRTRNEMMVEISTEDDDNFEKNLVTIRAELRAALAIYRPNAFVYGSLAVSPA